MDEHKNCIRDQHMLDLQMQFHSNNFHFLVRLEFLLVLQPKFWKYNKLNQWFFIFNQNPDSKLESGPKWTVQSAYGHMHFGRQSGIKADDFSSQCVQGLISHKMDVRAVLRFWFFRLAKLSSKDHQAFGHFFRPLSSFRIEQFSRPSNLIKIILLDRPL